MERTIRVMVIDDEESARNLLKTVIPWKELNMEVAGEAASGIEAINIIDDVKPDIAFVDITMPFMNGIEFTELATKRYPQLKIIIMTAHDQFEYARKCVSLPVSEYMLKPPVNADIVEILEKMGKEISGSEDKWEDGEKEKEGHDDGQEAQYAADAREDALDQQTVDGRVDVGGVQRLIRPGAHRVQTALQQLLQPRADDVEGQVDHKAHDEDEHGDRRVLAR